MALGSVAVKANSLLLGTCLPCLKHNASKIVVTKMEFDNLLNMYFKKKFVFMAEDPEKICKSGDIVLIQELPERKTTSITHKVLEVLYPLGDVTDPVTGKKVVGRQFRDEIEENDSLYGELKSRFDHKSAPKRGWQQDKKDFSHREPYIKYHEFDEGDENEHQPYSSSY